MGRVVLEMVGISNMWLVDIDFLYLSKSRDVASRKREITGGGGRVFWRMMVMCYF